MQKFISILLLLTQIHFQSNGETFSPADTLIKQNIAWDELNPRAVGFVKDYLATHQERLTKMKSWGTPYFIAIENILKRYHLPTSLKYLAVIESDLKTTALSSAGAVGPWQLMPGTARDLGLTVTKTRDDRTDLTKSTHAAARFLSILYEQLGDWLLVVAAYNGGPARLDNIIKRNDKKNFWDIQQDLPVESRNHVKKFIATHYIFEGQGSETTGKTSTTDKPVLSSTEISKLDSINISGRYDASTIAEVLEIKITDFNKWNPNFNEKVSAEVFQLRIPKDKTPLFHAQQELMLKRSVLHFMEEGKNLPEGFPSPSIDKKQIENKKVEKKKTVKK